MDTDDDSSMNRAQQSRATQKSQGQQRRGGALQSKQQDQGVQDIWAQVQPAITEAREYIEGSPVRAAAIGAVAGGLLMTLFSTEKGRSFVKMAYDYANPVVAKYAREFISQRAGEMTESALSQH